MRLLFQNVPRYMRTADTEWMYGRWGYHADVPPGEQQYFFAVRGTLASSVEDLREVLERELTADPK